MNCGFTQSVLLIVSSESLSPNCSPYLGLTKSNPGNFTGPYNSTCGSYSKAIPFSSSFTRTSKFGEWGPVWVHVPFPLQDVWQIKIDLGIFANNPDKYIEVFQGHRKFFDLAWGDVMLVLNQTLTGEDKDNIISGSQQWGFLVAQTEKILTAMQESQVQSLDQENPLEKGMTTQSSILVSRFPWTEEPGRLESMGSQRVRH